MIIEPDLMKANTMNLGSKLAITLFTLIAVGHLLWLRIGIDVSVGAWGVPQSHSL